MPQATENQSLLSDDGKEKIEAASLNAEQEATYKLDFTAWIYNELRLGKKSVFTYLPFVPLLGTTLFGYLKDYLGKTHSIDIGYTKLFYASIVVQAVLIFWFMSRDRTQF